MPFTYEFPRPCVTVDAVIFSKPETGLKFLLIRRANEPFKEMWALPGGFVEMDETLEEAINREVKEEIGLSGIQFKQLHTFSAVNRDPRHRTISTVFTGFVKKELVTPEAGDDASEAAWFAADNLPPLAFDHNLIIAMAVEKIGKDYFQDEESV
jgi:8-oxo-dGTP diphosphatase